MNFILNSYKRFRGLRRSKIVMLKWWGVETLCYSYLRIVEVKACREEFLVRAKKFESTFKALQDSFREALASNGMPLGYCEVTREQLSMIDRLQGEDAVAMSRLMYVYSKLLLLKLSCSDCRMGKEGNTKNEDI
jgi:hypothetical protein